MAGKGRRTSDGGKIPWGRIDPTLGSFAELRRRLPHKRNGRSKKPIEGSAPTTAEIADAYNQTKLKGLGVLVNAAHIRQRLVHHHGEDPTRFRIE